MRDAAVKATFTLGNMTGETTIEVVGENRALSARNGVFTDRFESWDAHIYRIGVK
jgi:hypothetical protein